MSRPLLIPMPGNEAMAAALATALGGEVGELETRQFPDGESYLRLATDIAGRMVAIVCTLDHPNGKFLPLSFTAATARELGAPRVGLVAPYLAYMRQDRRFKDGEAVTSTCFARLISSVFDWLVTVDPHLHRHSSLDEIYTIPGRIAPAAPALAEWIRLNVARPLVVGPDSESEQWVSRVASAAGCPHVVLRKVRRGDREVEISIPDLSAWADRTPVLVDDIASSARTMIETCRRLSVAGLPTPICIAVHALFDGESYRALSEVAARIVTTNSVPHQSSEIDLSDLIAIKVADVLDAVRAAGIERCR
jgi:ribose-phosphate pyrophosphokinase